MTSEMQLHQLQGVAVSAVCFVQDYVELHFDGPILRCLAGPLLKSGSFAGAFPDAGTRDALCSLIGQTVINVSLKDKLQLEMEFSTGTSFTIPLDPRRRSGPESMHFVPQIGGPIQVW